MTNERVKALLLELHRLLDRAGEQQLAARAKHEAVLPTMLEGTKDY